MLEAALRLLEVRQRSAAEVRQRLRRAGFRDALIDATIERLLELEVLDDAAFTDAWVESRDRARPRGERALRTELRRKGIDPGTIDAAMAARRPAPGASSDPDVTAAERLLARHAGALERVSDPRRRRQRAYALLARNGIDPGVAADVIRARIVEPAEDAE